MGNCIRSCEGLKAEKKDDEIMKRVFNEEKKFKVCKDRDGVVRVKVLVTRKELEKLMKHCNNRNKARSAEGSFNEEMLIKSITDAEMRNGIGEWKPDLESIPEEYSVAC